MEPMISVIIPVYKVEQYLARCVDSVLRQTYQNFEIILVDDGSPDRCGALCDEYARQDPRISVIHKENGGLSSARNAGIEAAKGRWLQFLDSDDYIAEDMMENLLNACLQDHTSMAIGGRIDVDAGTGAQTPGLVPGKRETIPWQECIRRLMLQEGGDFSSWDKLYAAELFREIRFPLGRICEDVAIMYRVIREAGQVSMVPTPVSYYYHRPDSITTAGFAEKNFAMVEFSGEIYRWVPENCPEILPAAKTMYIRSVIYTLIHMTRAKPEFQKKFRDRYVCYRRDLRRLLGFTLKSPDFRRNQKAIALLLCVGLFHAFDPIRRRK